ncbi:hypothetical protein R1sor_012011 [Riccia sorocarpa]|uniref:W2 domain-containing protein n=1 Tax=Riccia sorocarpa TaxID=122646 RepID=A0ABD3I2K4_9MARC
MRYRLTERFVCCEELGAVVKLGESEMAGTRREQQRCTSTAKMALQNIGAGNSDDVYYRYKMPKLMTKIEGRGNGIKTNVVNMVEVAKALARPPSYTTKFFGCELGAQSKFDDKTGTSIVNGAHETSKLAGLLEIFIKKYVQCYGCGNPETTINITKSQTITMKCAACGFVSDVDMRDKLTTFILKNPPEPKKGGKKDKQLRRAEKERLKEGEAADKAKKELTKKKKDETKPETKVIKKKGSDEDLSSQGDEDEAVEAEDDGVQWQTDTSAEAAKRRIEEQLTAATSEMVMIDEEAVHPSSPTTKTSKENKSNKLQRKPSSKKVEVVAPEEPEVVEVLPELEELSLHSVLVSEFKGCLEKGFTPAQLASFIERKEESKEELLFAYFEALFGSFVKGISKEVKEKKQYLSKVTTDEASQILLLKTLETFCAPCAPDAGKELALILKMLYDEDILEEDQILEWYDNGDENNTKSIQVRKYAQPFVDWVRDAEADEEEDE